MHDETHDTSSLPYFSPEHELLRAQIRRFVERDQTVRPGMGRPGIRPARGLATHGDFSAFGTRNNMAARNGCACERGAGGRYWGAPRSAVLLLTVLVHTDMASVHIY